ncbi:MAG: malto-oligosyltrehalose trehalohydrolase, partial [Verrucomicrobiota bacterium]
MHHQPTVQSCRPAFEKGVTTWRVWAPRAAEINLILDQDGASDCLAMEPEASGYFTISAKGANPGQRYGYQLDGGPIRPDPCSLWQPEGVHEKSALYCPGDFSWENTSPRIRREDLIIYELHIGTFTEAGTFDAAIER